MDVVAFDGIDREAVYSDDDTDILYYRWTISVVATLNPGTVYGRGLSPTMADVITRQRLLTPRQKLFLVSPSAPGSGGNLGAITQLPADASSAAVPLPYEVLLECPKTFNGSINEPDSDAKDGPTPLKLDITQIHGTGTFLVRYVIRCHETPSPPSGGTGEAPSPLASHRWTMSFGSDDHYFTVRKIDGKAIFRKDMLAAYDMTVDDFRALLMHPIPLGFKRMPPQAEMSSDGTELNYSILDVEQANNFNPYSTGAVKIDIAESVVLSRAEGLLGVGLGTGTAAKAIEGVRDFAEGAADLADDVANKPGAFGKYFGMGLPLAKERFWNSRLNPINW